MSSTETINWLESNQRYLAAAVARVRWLLENYIARSQDAATPAADSELSLPDFDGMQDEMKVPPALETLCQLFGLSPFERNILLLCAGVELDSALALRCAAAQDDSRKHYPTFSLALAALPEAHWSALSPAGPLRYWRMLEVVSSDNLTTSALRLDERILHYLTGLNYTDERLRGFIEPVSLQVALVPSHHELAQKAISAWTKAAEAEHIPVLQFYGPDVASQRAIATAVCSITGVNLQTMPAQVIPLDPRESEALVRLWEREARLTHSALLLDCADNDNADRTREAAVSRLIQDLSTAVIMTGKEQRAIPERSSISFEVQKPTSEEQRFLWQQALGTENNGQIESLVSQFNLNASALHSICDEALSHKAGHNGSTEFGKILWNTCRVQARPRLDELAQHIRSTPLWDDLVLPEMQRQLLSEIAAHVRRRLKVYETWGFGNRSSRGLGISALFVGPSGTGKTMAAEVLANELRLDLYRIDLSQVVSKYIGETEKNLRRVFDAAEDSGSILLFDEADALFGKRSEVKDSHDRYANIEISYLLQRMEAYRGLAILTTNMKEAIDTAFLRRIRFVVQFPFPSLEQRAEIWRRIFPADTPTEGLNMEKLAQLNVAGGNIRNIALHAAFLAADADEPVRMKHLLRAARVEYSKLEKPLTDTEIRGWI